MSRRTTIPLLVIAALLLIVDFWLAGPNDSDVSAEGPVRTLDFNTVNAIAIEGDSGSIRIELVESGLWKLASAENRGANQDRVQRLLEIVEGLLNPESILSQVGDPRRLGLEPPRGRVVLETEDGERLVVNLGYATPESEFVPTSLNSESWARKADTELSAMVSGPLAHWRSRKFSTLNSAEVRRIEVRNSVDEFVLEKREGSPEWRMTAPVDARAHSAKVRYQINEQMALSTVRALGNQDDWVSTGSIVKMTLMDGELATFEIGEPNASQPSWIPIRRSRQGDVVFVDRSAMAFFLGSHEAVRDPRLFEFELDAVESVSIEQTNEPFELRRTQTGDWNVVEGSSSEPADPRSATRFVGAIAYIDVTEFTELTPEDAGMEVPQAVLRISGADWEKRLIVGHLSPKGLVYVKTDRSDEVVAVSMDQIEPLSRRVFTFRERKISDWSVEDLTSVRLARLDASKWVPAPLVREYRRFSTGEWTVAPPYGGHANRFSMEETLVRLLAFEPDEWLDRGAQALSGYGMQANGYRLELFSSGGKTTIWVGGGAPQGGRFAATSIDGVPHVFELTPELWRLIQKDFSFE